MEVSNRRQVLRALLDETLTTEEVKTACFDLDIDFDNLPGDNKLAKIRELINYCERKHLIPTLINLSRSYRPSENWPEPWYFGGRDQPTNVDALFSEATQLMIYGRFGRALELYQQVKELDPYYPNITMRIREVESYIGERNFKYFDAFKDVRGRRAPVPEYRFYAYMTISFIFLCLIVLIVLLAQ